MHFCTIVKPIKKLVVLKKSSGPPVVVIFWIRTQLISNLWPLQYTQARKPGQIIMLLCDNSAFVFLDLFSETKYLWMAWILIVYFEKRNEWFDFVLRLFWTAAVCPKILRSELTSGWFILSFQNNLNFKTNSSKCPSLYSKCNFFVLRWLGLGLPTVQELSFS